MLIFKKQSNIDFLKISYYLTLHFSLNSSKWKTFYWVERQVNCHVYFNRLLLLTSFFILTFNADYLSYIQLEILLRQELEKSIRALHPCSLGLGIKIWYFQWK